MSQILFITAKGHVEEIRQDPSAEHIPDLEEMQKWVGGLIEIRSIVIAGGRATMVFNEEGLIKNLEPNWCASAFFHAHSIASIGQIPLQSIVGPAILFAGVELP